jgi:crotonyl-CoA reductase
MKFSGSAIEAATPDELAGLEVPGSYRAAHISRDDIGMFEGVAEKDVRMSLKVGDVPLPELAPDEVLVAVMASAINYNTVWSAIFEPLPTFLFLHRMGQRGGWDARHDQPHHVLGSDASGVVLKVGGMVRKWSVGDRVVAFAGWGDQEDPMMQMDGVIAKDSQAWGFETNFGGLATLAILKTTQLMPKPKHLSWEEAAANTLCAMTAYRMLVSPRGVGMKQGDIVLVWGATGGLGSYAIQFIRNGGGIAVGVVSSERKAELMERIGCDVIVRRDQDEMEGLSGVALGKQMRKAVRGALGEDPHVAFEHVGRETFGASVYLVRKGGTVITCGSSTGFEHEFDNRYLWMKSKRIIGSHAATWQEAWESNRLIDQGKIVPALSTVHQLDEVGEAAREVQLNRHVGKVGVLCLAEEEGLGVEDEEKRAEVGESRLRLFRDFAAPPATVGQAL